MASTKAVAGIALHSSLRRKCHVVFNVAAEAHGCPTSFAGARLVLQGAVPPSREGGPSIHRPGRTAVARYAAPVDVEPEPPVLEDELALDVELELDEFEALMGTTGSLLAKICCTPLSI
jgi:hypothetical protein